MGTVTMLLGLLGAFGAYKEQKLSLVVVLGMVLSSIMIHQLRQPNRTTIFLSVPAIFTPGPPKYQELHNPPPPY
ncbi:hypothetical protein XENOCAPTIV_017256 [Xenoophorus captivus]|uniref:Uncharacterized protein n=1 Tax=Xenoophorus captivus TaxID=1517983 RepID=A0ABV0QER3_9TELE